MPDILKEFLENLDIKSSDEVWDYFDSNPHAIEEVVEILFKNVNQETND